MRNWIVLSLSLLFATNLQAQLLERQLHRQLVLNRNITSGGGGGGGISEVSSKRATSNTTGGQDSKTLAVPSGVTSGQLIAVGGAIWTSGGTTVAPAVTDSLGNTYTIEFDSASGLGVNWALFTAYTVSGSSGACTITVNPNGASSDFSFSLDVFSGVTQLDVDGSVSSGNPSAGPAQDTILTVAADTLILCTVSNEAGTTMTPLTNYTEIGEAESGASNQPHSFLFRIVSSATTYTPGVTLGASTTWMAQSLSLKP